MFKAMLRAEIPDHFDRQAYCRSCEQMGKPEWRRSGRWSLISAPDWRCGHCGSSDLAFMSTYEGRRLYLELTNNHEALSVLNAFAK